MDDAEKRLENLQLELVHLLDWIKTHRKKVLVIFEGRDASGKGGMIKRVSERLNPRFCKVVALDKPTEQERSQWYFQRYIQNLPKEGELVLFDRSWYNRAGVERVMSYCSDTEYYNFLETCPDFEKMLISSGIILVKYWLSISQQEQLKRFKKRASDPLKQWKLSKTDIRSIDLWQKYSDAVQVMLERTHTDMSPWHVIDGNNKEQARINLIQNLLSQFPYQQRASDFDLDDINFGQYTSDLDIAPFEKAALSKSEL